MAMSVTEATAANDLISYITGRERGASGEKVSRERALEAANTLARSSHKKLMAGYKGDGDVEVGWPE